MTTIVTGHQPEFLPWAGYFNKIIQSDVFIIVDDVQYKKRTFENRNKIRSNNDKGHVFITIPVEKCGSFPRINEVYAVDNNWRDIMLKSLYLSYSKSPYFDEVEALIKECLYSSDKLVTINVCLIKKILKYLAIKRKVLIQSELNISAKNGTELIVNLARYDCCNNIYLSGPHGRDYLDFDHLERVNQKIVFSDFIHPEYNQMHYGFISHMSIVDLLFNYGKKSVEFISNVNYVNQ
jgi:hypothetical protein